MVNIAKRNKWLHARDTAARSGYGFQALEPLPQFADKENARAILQTLANDRGILAVMAEHKYGIRAWLERFDVNVKSYDSLIVYRAISYDRLFVFAVVCPCLRDVVDGMSVCWQRCRQMERSEWTLCACWD